MPHLHTRILQRERLQRAFFSTILPLINTNGRRSIILIPPISTSSTFNPCSLCLVSVSHLPNVYFRARSVSLAVDKTNFPPSGSWTPRTTTDHDKKRTADMYTYEKMPASTLAAPDGFSNQTFVSTNNRRPHTARSGRSAGARSPSPLFRWTRKNTHEQDKLESGDFRSSMDSRAIISSATSKGVPHHQLTHTYNISTSTTSSKRQSQSGLPPPLSREEFEALPVAIQRKVCSIQCLNAHGFCHISIAFPHSFSTAIYPLVQDIVAAEPSCKPASTEDITS